MNKVLTLFKEYGTLILILIVADISLILQGFTLGILIGMLANDVPNYIPICSKIF